jgi:transposase
MLRSVRPASPSERVRKELAQDLVRDLRTADASLADIERRMTATLDHHGARLRQVDGVAAVTAVRLIGRTGPASRFATADAFATSAGVAPIEVASGERTRHRLSRAGDRQLNSAIHLIAVTQVRMRHSLGRRYYDTKIAEGKTHNEAMRCLTRRLANHLWRAHDRRRTQTHHHARRRRSRGLTEHRGTLGLMEARAIGFQPRQGRSVGQHRRLLGSGRVAHRRSGCGAAAR